MIAFLLGVPGKLKTLTDRLTSARATNLDNADVPTSTRAPSSTALSNVTWTDALAAILGNTIQTTILSGNVQTGYVSGAGTSGTGEDTTYIDVTITAVAAIAKCKVEVMGAGGGNQSVNNLTARLTSTTNLRISSVSSGAINARWYVIPLK